MKRRLAKALRCIASLALLLCMSISCMLNVHAAETDAGASAPAQSSIVKTADSDTSKSWSSVLGADNSTRYNGRLWTDKTVSTDSITFTGKDENNTDVSYDYSVDPNSSDQLLVTYSMLGTSTEITKETASPVDVMFVLDFSSSMNWGVQSEEVDGRTDEEAEANSRLKAMVDAMNSTIDTLARSNSNNRIGIVVFNNSASTLLPLGNVTPKDDKNYLEISSFTLKAKEENKKQEADSTVKENITSNGTSLATGSGTNVQAGLFEGMSTLAEAEDTTVEIGGKNVTREPYVILMSDGAPTVFSGSDDTQWTNEKGKTEHGNLTKDSEVKDNTTVYAGSWWDNIDNVPTGRGDTSYPDSADGLMAVLTGSYFKKQINENYNETAKFYTIGFATDEQTDAMKEMVQFILNPADKTSSSDQDVQQAIDALNSYLKGNDITVSASIGDNDNTHTEKHNYQVGHPSSEDDITGTLNYNDAYYSASNSDQLQEIFDNLASEITEAKLQTPTDGGTDGLDPNGYVTYTDPIGKYMEVKDVKGLLFSGKQFTVTDDSPVVSDDQNTYTYKFEGKISSPVYGEQNANEILVQVIKNSDGSETMKVTVPAAAIPLRTNKITEKADGKIDNTWTEAYPLRLIYSVGPVADADIKVAMDAGYSKEDDGTVRLYTNLYSGKTLAENSSIHTGDATVTFQPASDNPFYFFQEDTPIYTDDKCADPVAAGTTINDTDTYYFSFSYYEGSEKKSAVIARTGNYIKNYVTEHDGKAYIAKGAPRLGNLADIAEAKSSTFSAGSGPVTDAYVRATSATRNSGSDTWNMTTYLGNNGALAISPAKLKSVKDSSGNNIDKGTVTIGDTLTYEISYANITGSPADITITDVVPAGTKYDSSENSGSYDSETNTVTWSLKAVPAGETGSVKFTVKVAEEAVKYESISNTAKIAVGDPNPSVTTNTVTDTLKTGDLKISKSVARNDGLSLTDAQEAQEFTIVVTGPASLAGKTYTVDSNDQVTFNAVDSTHSAAELTIKHGEEKTIKNLPAGIKLQVSEAAASGYTASYSATDVTVAANSTQAVAVTNTYSLNPCTVTIHGTKNLTGGKALTNGEFSFGLYDETGTDLLYSQVNDGNGEFNFDLTYSKPGEYKYVLKEIEPSDDQKEKNITYSDQEYAVTVNVSDNGDGTMSSAVTVDEKSYTDDSIQFTNEYKPESVTWTPEATKTIDSTPTWATDQMFSYVVAQKGSNGDYTDVATGTSAASGTVNFTGVELSAAGTYEFRITEKDTQQIGIGYDTNAYYAKVEVGQDKDGVLSITSVSYYSDEAMTVALQGTPEFKNTYTPDTTTASLTLEAKKAVSGDAYALKDNEFSFNLYDENNNVVATGQNKADGTVTFTALTYDLDDITAPGTYHVYTMKEVTDGSKITGMTYDESKYTVYVSVTYADGKLTASEDKIEKDGVEVTETPVFTNTYTEPKGKMVEIDATKELSGRDLQNQEFSFVLEDSTGNQVAAAQNDASGNVAFNVWFPADSATGSYEYVVKEVKGSDAEIDYDTNSYRVVVSISKDNGGNVQASVDYPDGEIVFQNKYIKPVSMVLNGSKTVKNWPESAGNAFEGGSYSFWLVPENEGEAKQLATADANGKFSWTLQYGNEDAGKTFKYDVYEDNGGRPGIVYDETHYTVSVSVTKNKDGSLSAEAVLADGSKADGNIVFENEYAPEAASLTLSGTKRLTNHELKDGEFSFTVVDSKGNEVAAGKNDASGNIAFNEMKFSDAGTYEYTVKEVKGTEAGIIYDSSEYQVTVTVSHDTVEGKLVAQVTSVKKDGKDADGITFVNEYSSQEYQDSLDLPTTGIYQNPAVWGGVIVCAAALIGLVLYKRNKKTGAR